MDVLVAGVESDMVVCGGVCVELFARGIFVGVVESIQVATGAELLCGGGIHYDQFDFYGMADDFNGFFNNVFGVVGIDAVGDEIPT